MPIFTIWASRKVNTKLNKQPKLQPPSQTFKPLNSFNCPQPHPHPNHPPPRNPQLSCWMTLRGCPESSDDRLSSQTKGLFLLSWLCPLWAPGETRRDHSLSCSSGGRGPQETHRISQALCQPRPAPLGLSEDGTLRTPFLSWVPAWDGSTHVWREHNVLWALAPFPPSTPRLCVLLESPFLITLAARSICGRRWWQLQVCVGVGGGGQVEGGSLFSRYYQHLTLLQLL